MKQVIIFKTSDVPEFSQKYIAIWLKQKRYDSVDFLTLGQVIELSVATSFTFYQDDSDGRFFDNSLQTDDGVIEWDGEELIDTLFYHILQNIKKRLVVSRTFNNNY